MKASKKLLALLLSLAMVFAMAVPAMASDGDDGVMPISAAPENDMTGKIVILHTNDVHGAVENYAKVAALKAEYEAAGASVLLMDAGDFSQGTTSVSVSEGATAIELMNMVGYDVAAPGNHEFDYGYANLKTLEAAAEFPILAANVKYNGENAFGDHTIIPVGDIKIGVFGLDTPETATKAHPAKIVGVTFVGGEEMYALAQAEVDALQAEGCDYIICLGHLGIDAESAVNRNRSVDLLANVTGIDVFIDGHSHSTLEKVLDHESVIDGKVGDTYLTSTGTKLNYIGVVILDGENITIESPSTENITVAEDDPIAARAKAIKDEIDALYGQVFGNSKVDLTGTANPGNRTEETNMGNLITEAMLWYVTKDSGLDVDNDHVVAVTNGGGIRAPIAAGDITRKDINTVLPFGNTVCTVYITGAALLEALEASTFCTPGAVGGFPQISGLNITVDTTVEYDAGENYPGTTYAAPASINRVTINSVNGNAFDLNATYAVVTNDFVAAGGDTYYAFSTSPNIVDTGTPLDIAVMEYITNVLGGTVSEKYAEPAGNMTIITATEPEPQPEPDPETTIYVVVAGDNLSKIALRYYGASSKWSVIYNANRNIISNPNLIYIGQQLLIPAP